MVIYSVGLISNFAKIIAELSLNDNLELRERIIKFTTSCQSLAFKKHPLIKNFRKEADELVTEMAESNEEKMSLLIKTLLLEYITDEELSEMDEDVLEKIKKLSKGIIELKENLIKKLDAENDALGIFLSQRPNLVADAIIRTSINNEDNFTIRLYENVFNHLIEYMKLLNVNEAELESLFKKYFDEYFNK